MAQQRDPVDAAPFLPCLALLGCLCSDAAIGCYTGALTMFLAGVMLYGLSTLFGIPFHQPTDGPSLIGLGLAVAFLCGVAACYRACRCVYDSETRRRDAWRLRAEADAEAEGGWIPYAPPVL